MQRELFNDFRRVETERKEELSLDSEQSSFLERVRVTLTLEKIILLVLANLVSFVLVYSLGFQRGRGPAAGLFPEFGVRTALISAWQSISKPFYIRAETGKFLEGKAQPAESLPVQNAPELPAAADVVKDAAQQAAIQAVAEGLYTIQLVTYRNESRAEQEVKTLSEKGHSSFIIPSGKFYQVCIERFSAKDHACKKLSEFKTSPIAQIYRGAYIRPIKR